MQSFCFCELSMQILWRRRCSRVVDLNLPKAWFPYDRPDRPGRPDRSKQCTDDPSDYMETVTES